MKVEITDPAGLGLVLRAVRRDAGVRQDDLAALAGVSKQFTFDVEHGKPTVQLGRVLKLLAELGIRLEADIPAPAMVELTRLRAKATSSKSAA